MEYIPREFAIGGVYFPPLLIAGTLGLLLAWLTMTLLIRWRLTHLFWYPPLAFLAIAVIYTGLIGTYMIPS